MFTALRPQDRFIKPPCGQRVDIHHPLAPFSCWLLNEGAGVSLNDAVLGRPSAAGQHTTNFPAWVGAFSSRSGPCLRFVASSSQYIDLADDVADAGFNLQLPWGQGGSKFVGSNNREFTYAVRLRTTNAGTTGLVPYVQWQGSNTLGLLQLVVNGGSSGRVQLQARDDPGTLLTITVLATGINDGSWHTIHAVNQGKGRRFLLSLDGKQIGAIANTLSAVLT